MKINITIEDDDGIRGNTKTIEIDDAVLGVLNNKAKHIAFQLQAHIEAMLELKGDI